MSEATPTYTFPPGPPPVPRNPISLLRYFLKLRKDNVGFVRERFETYGDMYFAPLGQTQLFVTRHPEHIQEVLVTKGAHFQKTEKGNAATQLKRFLGDGLLNSNGELWRRQRRMINPAFHRKRIASYAQMMSDYTVEMLDSWKPGQTLDVSHAMMALTLRIVSRALFDHDARTDTDRVSEAMESFRESFRVPAAFSWLPLPSVRRAKRALVDIDTLVYGMIDERLNNQDSLDTRLDLLSAMIQAVDVEGDNTSMTRKQLRDEVLTLFLAGHETTSHALTWTLYLLSQHPEAEARVQQELHDALGDTLPTMEHLSSLPFLTMCLKESMRLYPPVYVISRAAKEDTQVGGYDIPQGAEVLIWLYLAHHDPRWFPEPETFKPERFSPEQEPQIPKGAYNPFGAGTRTCIGKSFAMMEAQLLLATILQRFRLRHVEGHRVAPNLSVTLSPKYGMMMQLEKR